MMNEKKGMILYYDWLKPLSCLEAEDFKEVVSAMAEYSLSGTLPEQISPLADMALGFIIPQLARAKESARNGALGGRPKKADASLACQNKECSADSRDSINIKEGDENRDQICEDVSIISEENVVTDNNKTAQAAPERTAKAEPGKGVGGSCAQGGKVANGAEKRCYGDFKNVFLTESEYEDVRQRFPFDYTERINDVSYYIYAKGDKYESHHGAILNWCRNQKSKQTTESSNSTFDTDDFFANALARSERKMKEHLQGQKRSDEEFRKGTYF